MTEEKFQMLIRALAANWRMEPTEALFMGYWLGCEGMTDADLSRAASRALRECSRMPDAHELRKLGGEVQVDTAATLAWSKVLRAISQYGAYKSLDFGPVVNATIRSLGGWVELCSRDSDDLREWGRKDFERTYVRLAQVSMDEEMTGHLPGIVERQNKALGAVEKPIRLLDAVKSTAIVRT